MLRAASVCPSPRGPLSASDPASGCPQLVSLYPSVSEFSGPCCRPGGARGPRCSPRTLPAVVWGSCQFTWGGVSPPPRGGAPAAAAHPAPRRRQTRVCGQGLMHSHSHIQPQASSTRVLAVSDTPGTTCSLCHGWSVSTAQSLLCTRTRTLAPEHAHACDPVPATVTVRGHPWGAHTQGTGCHAARQVGPPTCRGGWGSPGRPLDLSALGSVPVQGLELGGLPHRGRPSER